MRREVPRERLRLPGSMCLHSANRHGPVIRWGCDNHVNAAVKNLDEVTAGLIVDVIQLHDDPLETPERIQGAIQMSS